MRGRQAGSTLEGLELRRALPVPRGCACPWPLGKHRQMFVSDIPDTGGTPTEGQHRGLERPLAEHAWMEGTGTEGWAGSAAAPQQSIPLGYQLLLEVLGTLQWES